MKKEKQQAFTTFLDLQPFCMSVCTHVDFLFTVFCKNLKAVGSAAVKQSQGVDVRRCEYAGRSLPAFQ